MDKQPLGLEVKLHGDSIANLGRLGNLSSHFPSKELLPKVEASRQVQARVWQSDADDGNAT
jgi:hypothetical protein